MKTTSALVTNAKPKVTPTVPKKQLVKLDLSGIAPATAGQKSEYPTLNDPQVAKLVDFISKTSEQIEALEGTVETAKADLVDRAKRFYFHDVHGKVEIPSSIACDGKDRKALLIFKNQYKAASDEEAVERMTGDHYADLFHQQFSLKIDGDKIPEAADKVKLLGELQALFVRYNASAALTAKAEIKPTSDFHVRRHTLFSEQENIALDKFVPIVASVKTKNVK